MAEESKDSQSPDSNSSAGIIDTHVHLWDPGKLRYRWLDDVPALRRPYLPHDYHQATLGYRVDALVFVQCDCDTTQSFEEVQWVSKLAESDPRVQAIVAHAPLEQGARCHEQLEQLATQPLVRGVRRLIQSEKDVDFCIQPKFVEGVRLLHAFNFSFDLCVYHTQLANVVRLVEQCPDVNFVLDHIAKPDIRNHVREPWMSNLRKLAALPNVCCKVSGVITEADHEQWTVEDIRPYIEYAIDCFGGDRILFGSDWPVVNLAGGWQRWISTLEMIVTNRSHDERSNWFHNNAKRVYRLQG